MCSKYGYVSWTKSHKQEHSSFSSFLSLSMFFDRLTNYDEKVNVESLIGSSKIWCSNIQNELLLTFRHLTRDVICQHVSLFTCINCFCNLCIGENISSLTINRYELPELSQNDVGLIEMASGSATFVLIGFVCWNSKNASRLKLWALQSLGDQLDFVRFHICRPL